MTNFLPAISNGHTGFLSYLRAINSIPSLEAEEELMYAKKYVEEQDLSAAQKLVESHLKLVAKIALSFSNYGLPVVDLVSEGNLGLMQAVRKFDPEKGVRLSTYAMWWIKASIQEFVLRSWSLVKIGTTAAQKKLFFNLARLKRKITHAEGREFQHSDYKQIANELNVSEAEVIEMDVRLKQDHYLDTPIGDEESESLISLIPETRANQEIVLLQAQENKNRKNMLYKAMGELNEREQYIIQARKLKSSPATLEDLSLHFGISKERVRQIEEKALEKMTNFVKVNQVA